MQQVQRSKGPEGGYGFGLTQIYDERFGTIVSHSGGLPGYGSNMRWLPGRRTGVITLANATYAGMGRLAQEMLVTLDEHGLVAPPAVDVDPDLQQAAERLVALLQSWDDAAADRLFADNVALDESYAQRAAAAAELVAAKRFVAPRTSGRGIPHPRPGRRRRGPGHGGDRHHVDAVRSRLHRPVHDPSLGSG
jgi:hypothetical protein